MRTLPRSVSLARIAPAAGHRQPVEAAADQQLGGRPDQPQQHDHQHGVGPGLPSVRPQQRPSIRAPGTASGRTRARPGRPAEQDDEAGHVGQGQARRQQPRSASSRAAARAEDGLKDRPQAGPQQQPADGRSGPALPTQGRRVEPGPGVRRPPSRNGRASRRRQPVETTGGRIGNGQRSQQQQGQQDKHLAVGLGPRRLWCV